MQRQWHGHWNKTNGARGGAIFPFNIAQSFQPPIRSWDKVKLSSNARGVYRSGTPTIANQDGQAAGMSRQERRGKNFKGGAREVMAFQMGGGDFEKMGNQPDHTRLGKKIGRPPLQSRKRKRGEAQNSPRGYVDVVSTLIPGTTLTGSRGP